MEFTIEKPLSNKSGIYSIKSLICERIYIGSTKNFRKRYREHLQALKRNNHSSKKLQRFYNKYGTDKLIFSAIELCEVSELSRKEQHWLDKTNSYKHGFNCNPISGGLIGLKRTKKWNDNISKSNKGKILSDEHKKNLSIAGRKRKDNVSDYLPKNQKGSKHPMSKLSEQNVLEIRKKFKPRIYTQKMLSDEFNVSIGTIKRIIQNRNWKHV